MTKDEALKLALEALDWEDCNDDDGLDAAKEKAITAIKEALAQPEQEPVAWMTITPYGEEDDIWYENPEGKLLDDWTYKPLYTTPPKAQPEQKYRRGDRLVCLETDEYCVIHIAGTDRQWVKFPDTHIGVYTNEQVDQLFEKLARETDLAEPEQKPVAWPVGWVDDGGTVFWKDKPPADGADLYTVIDKSAAVRIATALGWEPKRKPLSEERIDDIWNLHCDEMGYVSVSDAVELARDFEAAHGIWPENSDCHGPDWTDRDGEYLK